ncbi:branched-chain alpha-keto acid dehydrogenase subunit E2 [Gammaproteobacteria bacterium 42_54_T18]|nr:branched-chain alpha-keto acid dehydrogenase subunit E2 [Gammaproteobacteria bacterium 42_54_T18]
MKYFKLPDLGEGLQEAEIVEWHISPGDTVVVDQIIVSVETAKAIVDVPSPQAGKIAALFGAEGDIIHTNEPLVEYVGEDNADTGTVVGVIQEATIEATVDVTTGPAAKATTSNQGAEVDQFIIGSAQGGTHNRSFSTPAIRALAKRLDVDINSLKGTGQHQLITIGDVERAHQVTQEFGEEKTLKGVRRVMAKAMIKAQEVVKVTLYDDADIHKWYGNQHPVKTDPTMRLIRAIGQACKAEPQLNAWFDGDNLSIRTIDNVDLGIAIDTEDGLFVPVLRDINNRSDTNLKQGFDTLRDAVKSRKIPPKEMMGATITLSNFGTIAGKYGNPVVVPPMVSILGAGTIHDQIVPYQGDITIHPIMPLSFSFDHRAVTGGEAARFLKAIMNDLEVE